MEWQATWIPKREKFESALLVGTIMVAVIRDEQCVIFVSSFA
jgi:hypothetical protein